MKEAIAVLGKSEGYVAAALLLSATATALLIKHFVDQATWAAFVEWVWTALVVGGVGKVASDAWSSSKAGGPVS